MKSNKHKLLAVAVAASVLGTAQPLWAQSNGSGAVLEEVLVTARKRLESEQELPITISAFTGDELDNRVVLDVRDLQAAIPGLQVSNSNQSSFPIFAIRGSETQNNVDGSVGLYFGDVPVLLSTSIANSFYDISSVEVLKGPQGTQFGANSSGGIVMVRPKLPSDEMEGYVKVGYGNYDRTELEGMINIPATDSLRFRLAGNYVERDGYIDNELGAGDIPDEFWDEDHYSLRGAMQYEGSRFSSDTIVDYYDADELFYVPIPTEFRDVPGLPGTNPENFGDRVGKPDKVFLAPNFIEDRPLNTEAEIWGIQHVLNFDLGEDWSLRNVTGYRSEELAASERSGPTSVHTITVLTDNDFDRLVNDLTISYDGGSRLRAAFGVYYQDDNRDQGVVATAAQNILLGLFGLPLANNVRLWNEREFESIAAYASFDYDLTDNLTAVVGLRYNWDEASLTYTPSGTIGLPDLGDNFFPDATAPCKDSELLAYADADFESCVGVNDEKFEEDTWNFALNYQFTPTTLVYGKVAKGYVAGGLNNNLREVRAYDPETQIQAEIGLKSDWELAGRPIRTNVAIYTGTIDDKQLVQNASYDDGTPANGVINAAEESIEGVDIDIQYLPFDGLSISLSYAYIDAEFEEFEFPALGGPDGPSFVPAQDLSGEQPARVPENQFNGTISWDLPIDSSLGLVTATITAYYSDESRVRNVEIFGPEYNILDDYWLWNASIAWEDIAGSSFSAQLWSNNLLDEEYENSKDAQFNTFGYATTRYGAPRTYGLNLSYRF